MGRVWRGPNFLMWSIFFVCEVFQTPIREEKKKNTTEDRRKKDLSQMNCRKSAEDLPKICRRSVDGLMFSKKKTKCERVVYIGRCGLDQKKSNHINHFDSGDCSGAAKVGLFWDVFLFWNNLDKIVLHLWGK